MDAPTAEAAVPHGAGRLLGLDLGSRRIGVAVSDSAGALATPLTTVERGGGRPHEHGRIAAIVEEYEAVGVVVGLPLSLSGAEGHAARAATEEVAELRVRLGVPVATADERMSTVAAAGALRAAGRNARQQRAVIDQTAAAGILQGWLDRHRRSA